MATPPFIVNILPEPNDPDASLVDFVRFTMRDLETYIDEGSIQVTAGYAKVKSDGEDEFEDELARTFRSSVLPGSLDPDPPTIEVLPGVRVTKTTNSPQRSVFFTSIDAGKGFDSALVTGVFDPSVSANAQGAVLGMEHGRRDTGAYLFFDSPGGSPRLRLVGPADAAGTHVPDTPIAHDWSAEVSRYIIVWNEVRGLVEVYVVTSTSTLLLASPAISTFQAYDTDLGVPTPKRGGVDEITAVYGIEGDLGDSVTITNIAVTTDVGFPIVGTSRPGNFITYRRTDEVIRYPGGDIRRLPVSPWNDPSVVVLPNVSASGAITTPGGKTRLSKDELGATFAVWREEPGFLRSATEGIMLEASFFAIPTQVENTRITGMGFLIWDGTTAFLLMLLEGELRNVGLLRSGNPINVSGSYMRPTEALDWGSPSGFRLTLDPRRELIELFSMDDLTTPILSTAFDRALFPDAADMGFTSEPPFIAVGHITETDTAGAFEVERVLYSHLYQAYEARDGAEPDNSLVVDPPWNPTSGGFGAVGPLFGLPLLGGGFGITPLGYFVDSGGVPSGSVGVVDEVLRIDTDPGELINYFRSADFGLGRGAVVEARLWIDTHKPRNRTGFFIILDDGLTSYMLSFVETDIGKFVAIPMRSGLSSFVEVVGTSGDGARFSRRVDWSEPHTYRLERRPLDGLYLFIDGEESLVILDSENADYPTTQYMTPSVSFGHFTSEGLVSNVVFVRTMFGSGFEVAFRKVDPVVDLEEEIRATQAVVVAYAEDLD